MADKKNHNPYQDIKTAKELVCYISVHGLETNQDAICRAQDIIGHSCEEELAALATDNKSRDEFYWLLFKIWHWEDATRFWNKFSNPERVMLADVNAELVQWKKDCKAWEENFDIMKKRAEEYRARIDADFSDAETLRDERDSARQALYAAQQEILVLKAKLYDLMIGGVK